MRQAWLPRALQPRTSREKLASSSGVSATACKRLSSTSILDPGACSPERTALSVQQGSASGSSVEGPFLPQSNAPQCPPAAPVVVVPCPSQAVSERRTTRPHMTRRDDPATSDSPQGNRHSDDGGRRGREKNCAQPCEHASRTDPPTGPLSSSSPRPSSSTARGTSGMNPRDCARSADQTTLTSSSAGLPRRHPELPAELSASLSRPASVSPDAPPLVCARDSAAAAPPARGESLATEEEPRAAEFRVAPSPLQFFLEECVAASPDAWSSTCISGEHSRAARVHAALPVKPLPRDGTPDLPHACQKNRCDHVFPPRQLDMPVPPPQWRDEEKAEQRCPLRQSFHLTYHVYGDMDEYALDRSIAVELLRQQRVREAFLSLLPLVRTYGVDRVLADEDLSLIAYKYFEMQRMFLSLWEDSPPHERKSSLLKMITRSLSHHRNYHCHRHRSGSETGEKASPPASSAMPRASAARRGTACSSGSAESFCCGAARAQEAAVAGGRAGDRGDREGRKFSYQGRRAGIRATADSASSSGGSEEGAGAETTDGADVFTVEKRGRRTVPRPQTRDERSNGSQAEAGRGRVARERENGQGATLREVDGREREGGRSSAHELAEEESHPPRCGEGNGADVMANDDGSADDAAVRRRSTVDSGNSQLAGGVAYWSASGDEDAWGTEEQRIEYELQKRMDTLFRRSTMGSTVALEATPWILAVDDSPSLNIWSRKYRNSTLLSFRIEGVVESSLVSVVSVLNEQDMYKDWVPYYTFPIRFGLKECTRVSQFGRVDQLDVFKIAFPWPVNDRDACLSIWAADDLETTGSYFVRITTCDEGDNVRGVIAPPPERGTERLYCEGALMLHPQSPASVQVQLLWTIDPRVSLPESLLTFLTRVFARSAFHAFRRVCAAAATDGHVQRRETRPYLYSFLQNRLDNLAASSVLYTGRHSSDDDASIVSEEKRGCFASARAPGQSSSSLSSRARTRVTESASAPRRETDACTSRFPAFLKPRPSAHRTRRNDAKQARR
ncbi:hypothetical protein BESB_084260 [Besnoitia besnoiti]|uniref:START domain-containing protein n=1 Tax=Besnoitia besnoiti TaxID=94643 RepID=A0A2A9MC89_BESBE|nr:hypothetical protein BESB_084260 [Besnoitia besnoiti]PFH33227.1 hypothetical protein BESB_084260 [Besnoitia besnoiti]